LIRTSVYLLENVPAYFCNRYSEAGASGAVYSWTGFGARRRIHFKTGLYRELQLMPQGVRLAVEAAQNKKAAGISVLDLSGVARLRLTS